MNNQPAHDIHQKTKIRHAHSLQISDRERKIDGNLKLNMNELKKLQIASKQKWHLDGQQETKTKDM